MSGGMGFQTSLIQSALYFFISLTTLHLEGCFHTWCIIAEAQDKEWIVLKTWRDDYKREQKSPMKQGVPQG